jgi:GTP cyclohydrolase I
MAEEKRYLEDVGMKNLPFPMKVTSKAYPQGQLTIANISVSARIMHEFQAQWIDKFIQIVHSHRDTIGTSYLKTNIRDYLKGLGASAVKVDFEYPFFVEKVTPVSKEKCLVRYMCTFSAKVSAVRDPRIQLKMEIPVITTFPESSVMLVHRPFGQLSAVIVEVESSKDVYPEDLVEIVDKHSLSGIYSFLTPEDQDFIIQRIHSNSKPSVVMVDEIKEELTHKDNVSWFSVNCSNFGMLHPYSTVIGTEKSMWIPETDVEDYELL